MKKSRHEHFPVDTKPSMKNRSETKNRSTFRSVWNSIPEIHQQVLMTFGLILGLLAIVPTFLALVWVAVEYPLIGIPLDLMILYGVIYALMRLE